MKYHLLSVVSAAAMLIQPATLDASVIYQPDFNSLPYKEGETIVGVDGWTKGTISSGNDLDASIVSSPWDEGSVLYLKSSKPLGGAGTVTVTRSFEKTFTGPAVRIDLVMAFDPYSLSDNAITSRIYFNSESATTNLTPLTLGFTRAAEGGIYYIGAAGQEVILEKSQVAPNSPYAFSILLNFEDKVFDLTVTGKNKDGSDFSFTSQAPIGFRVAEGGQPSSGINSMTMSQNSPSLSGYLGSVSIETIPEPSTLAALVTGGALLLGLHLRKR
ncbi:MAG TPA: PEP-CTERM sorting domain-containing protein [Chthoniobacteraceae bacterium]|nr:PEP-CTERM sorting domain-containing protein [Chthoniobacteraceae bacterium]